jgi:hypothetical protein
MSVLIVALPRTGSTVLMRAFIAQGYDYASEPWNPTVSNLRKNLNFKWKDIKPESNIVVKTMIRHLPHNSETSLPHLFYTEFAQQFDKVILLDRYDLSEQSISLSNAVLTDQWLGKYLPKHIPDELLKHQTLFLDSEKAELSALSHTINTNVVYYEDIYFGTQEVKDKFYHDWGIKSDEAKKLLDPKHKYRQTQNNTGLL